MTELLTHAALKGAVVLGIALLIGLLLRRVAAARRYAVWMTAVAVLGVMPLAMVVLPAWRVLPQTKAVAMTMEWPVEEVVEMPIGDVTGMSVAGAASTAVQASAAPVVAPLPEQEGPLFRFSWDEVVAVLPWAWLTVAGVLLMRLGCGAWCLSRLEGTLKAGTSEVLNDVVREVGLKRVPRLLIGAENAVPMVWGVWKTRLLLPAGFAEWPVEKLRGVLLHELAHLKRGDPLALWTAQWVKALHWFNPLAWLTIRQLRADQERACDDTVLRHGVRASEYAQHLLDLSRHTRVAPGLALCALTMTRCSPVEARVKAILDVRRSREGLTRRWLLGLAGVALLATVPVAMLHAIEGAKLRGQIVDRNGVVLAESTAEKVRSYPLKALAGHTMGYTRLPYGEKSQPVGSTGLEKMHDVALREGKDLEVSLDARIQAVVLRAMRDAGYKRGAAVVMDPRTGEILACVSLPVYDPNRFVPSISQNDWETLIKDVDRPLFDRCINCAPPGSAFMPFTALAGTLAGVSHSSFVCNGSVTYGARSFQCWKWRENETGHGALDMKGAIVASCNCYWYQFGNKAGTDSFERIGRLLGFGESYEIQHGEDKGILSSPDWMAKNFPKERWTPGHTANMSIGQGSMLTSPVQMAVLAATVAQRGKVPQPTYLKLKAGETVSSRADLITEGLAATEIDHIREGMRLVVNGDASAGKAARSEKVVIAGKTGTAQNWRNMGGSMVASNHGWFIGFAPYDHPTLAFAILKNGAKSGGSDCAPLAKRIVEETLALPMDGSGEVSPVDQPAPDVVGMEIMDEIGRGATALGKSFKVQEPEIADGKILLTGEAESIHHALSFFDHLRNLGQRRNIQWQIPVPTVQKDGRATFRAVGTYQTTQAAGDKPAARQVPDKTGGSEAEAKTPRKTSLVDEDRWKGLQKQGNLAPLPAGAVADVMTERDKQQMSGWFFFRFSAPREAVHPWLMDSLTAEMREQQAPSLMWPESPATFTRSYVAANSCEILVQCAEGDRAHVSITKKKRPVMIAPDEATPPTPKTAAPRELDGVVEVKPDPAKELKTLSTTLKTSSAKVVEIEAKQKGLIEKLRALRKERPLNQAAYNATMKEILALMKQVMPAPAPAKFVPASAKPPAEMERWKEVQKSGGLAELPPEALVEMLTRREVLNADAMWSSYFRFTVPREKAHAWLMASLSEKWRQKQAKMLSWPEAPEAFYRSYFVTDKCHIVVRSEDGKAVSVAVEKRKLPILIAPDEEIPPRSKTAAPRELEGVVSGDAPWRAPWAVPAFEMNLEVCEATLRGDEFSDALEVERRHKGVDKTLLAWARGR